MALHTESTVVLHSSDKEIQKGFERVKHQALHWVFEGYPVGDYYEAALPNREAFCMRDASHQAAGGEILGLSSHNKNMFLKFAQGISKSRDYCSYWEIDRWNRPCPVDYTDDSDFWYNLPANFDVLHACWRMYLWTGDKGYLTHPDFDNFYALTMEQYIKQWDHNGDGLPDSSTKPRPGQKGSEYLWKVGRRGVAGYDESRFARTKVVTATDTIAALARSYLSYAEMCNVLGRNEQKEIYHSRGTLLLDRLNKDLYTEDYGYAYGYNDDGEKVYGDKEVDDKNVSPSAFMFYWDVIQDANRKSKLLDVYAKQLPSLIENSRIEGLSHYPEIQWRYGRDSEALNSLRVLFDPALGRKEYPEASFCAIGAAATGLMGLKADARDGSISTRSGLAEIKWVEMNGVPALGRLVSVLHEGSNTTSFTLDEGENVIWRCSFWGNVKINVKGKNAETRYSTDEFTGKPYSYADIPVNTGETVSASAG